MAFRYTPFSLKEILHRTGPVFDIHATQKDLVLDALEENSQVKLTKMGDVNPGRKHSLPLKIVQWMTASSNG